MPWDEVDELLVHGEVDETGSTRFPSFRELGARFHVSHSSVSRYARRHNCLQRREHAQKRKTDIADRKLGELRADELALKRDDIIRVIERFIVRFEQALEADRVRCDNPTDFNTMVRLWAFVMGDADARTELVAGFTLDDLAEAHKEWKEKMVDTTPKMRGEVVRLPAEGKAATKKRRG